MITLTDEASVFDDSEIEKQFKLSKYISMNNMHLFDRNGHIARYGSCMSVLQEFYDVRLEFYEKRKVKLEVARFYSEKAPDVSPFFLYSRPTSSAR